MVNTAGFRSWCAVLLLGALLLTTAAWVRGAEYDEQYTLFVTAGNPRPVWPDAVFPAGVVANMQAGHATFAGIARDLRATDVHPPLYFWVVSLWRTLWGSGLFAARLLSVLCGLVSLALIGLIARRCEIRPVSAMLLTLGCYGFIYTNAIARGFAPAQMLTLGGVALLLNRQSLFAGACFGAACCCNYLAVFVAAATVLTVGAWGAILTALPFLAVDAWFFAAQHGARPDQFVPFALGPSLMRLMKYEIASVFGGLPLYVDGIWSVAVGAGIGMVAFGMVLRMVVVGTLHAARCFRLVLAAAVAPAIGLLLLGAVFNNTPIELRYLSFGLPFIALLAASSATPSGNPLDSSQRGLKRLVAANRVLALPSHLAAWVGNGDGRSRALAWSLPVILVVQFAGIAGLLLASRTMQPAGATAAGAAQLAGDGVVILPRGNDGVGIVGAFGIEAPGTLPILLASSTDHIADRITGYHRVVLALVAQDRDSAATISQMRRALTSPDWRCVAIGFNLEVYERNQTGK